MKRVKSYAATDLRSASRNRVVMSLRAPFKRVQTGPAYSPLAG